MPSFPDPSGVEQAAYRRSQHGRGERLLQEEAAWPEKARDLVVVARVTGDEEHRKIGIAAAIMTASGKMAAQTAVPGLSALIIGGRFGIFIMRWAIGFSSTKAPAQMMTIRTLRSPEPSGP